MRGLNEDTAKYSNHFDSTLFVQDKDEWSVTCGVAVATPCSLKLTLSDPLNYPRRERRMDLELETAALKLFEAVIAVDLQIVVVSRSNHRVTATPPLFVYELLYCEQFVCNKKTNDG